MPDRPSLRDEQKRLTRQRLLDAAIEVFQRAGYAATVDDIAAAAGTGRATLYLHFASKADLIKELIGEFAKPEVLYGPLAELDEPNWDDVRTWLTQMIASRDARIGSALQNIISQAIRNEPDVTEDALSAFARGAAFLASVFERHGVTPADARTRALLLIPQLTLVPWLQDFPGITVDGERLLDVMADHWLLAFEPEPSVTRGRRSRASDIPARSSRPPKPPTAP